MLRSLTGLVAMLALIEGTAAQDIRGLQRTIDTLSSPPTAEELASLGERNPNAYVFFLQDFLKAEGGYGGAVDGQLTNATINAIVRFCREAGVLETCVRGPLLPQSIALVSEAVAAALAPVVEAVATPGTPEPAGEPVLMPMVEAVAVAEAPEPVSEPASIDVIPTLPEGWRLNDNGGRGTLGLAVTIVSAGPTDAAIRFSGTATRQGYFNVEVGPAEASEAGTWVTKVSASRESAEGSAGTIWLRTALFADKAYLGELFNGIRIGPGTPAAVLEGSGGPLPETTRLLPYVQLSVNAGDWVDTTIQIADPSLARVP